LVIALFSNPRGLPQKTPQIILFYDPTQDTFVAKEIGISLAGRGVDCTYLKDNPFLVCFFASYGDMEKNKSLGRLVEILPQGDAIDITRRYKLPYPVGRTQYDSTGFFQMGVVFIDFNRDDLKDLVITGQHSRFLAATQQTDHTFKSKYYGFEQEHIKISAPRYSYRNDHVVVPPCIYFAMENGKEGKSTDFVQCYNAKKRYFYNLPLNMVTTEKGVDPNGDYLMMYTEVIFWDHNGDGMMDFAAKRVDPKTKKEKWTLFSFNEHGEDGKIIDWARKQHNKLRLKVR